jgi:protein-L-isoaspartate(D-aspartate) O-methyltransferase
MSRERERKHLVARLQAAGCLKKPEVAEALLKVERHLFIPESQHSKAYVDMPLHIGSGQTISAPHMVAMMSEALDVAAGQKVLEVGTGSGYQAAVLGQLLKDGVLYSVERIPELAERAEKLLKHLGYLNVHVVAGEGTLGYEKEAPYDRIIVTAAAPHVPKALLAQLKDGGKILLPVGGRSMQELVLIEKKGREYKEVRLGGCMFVPLIGEDGWSG